MGARNADHNKRQRPEQGLNEEGARGRFWLLLLFGLPATHKTARVAIWRKLQKSAIETP
jgi:hypothetical protein